MLTVGDVEDTMTQSTAEENCRMDCLNLTCQTWWARWCRWRSTWRRPRRHQWRLSPWGHGSDERCDEAPRTSACGTWLPRLHGQSEYVQTKTKSYSSVRLRSHSQFHTLVSLYFKGRSKVAANLSAEVFSYLKAHWDMKLSNSGGHVVQGLLLCTADPQTHAMWVIWSHS